MHSHPLSTYASGALTFPSCLMWILSLYMLSLVCNCVHTIFLVLFTVVSVHLLLESITSSLGATYIKRTFSALEDETYSLVPQSSHAAVLSALTCAVPVSCSIHLWTNSSFMCSIQAFECSLIVYASILYCFISLSLAIFFSFFIFFFFFGNYFLVHILRSAVSCGYRQVTCFLLRLRVYVLYHSLFRFFMIPVLCFFVFLSSWLSTVL